MKTIIHNALIVTMNKNKEIIRNGSIFIEWGKIKEIKEGCFENSDAEYFDAQGMIVMPGFINTHTHSPMTMLRGYADDMELHTWLNKYIFPAEAKIMFPENIVYGTRLAMMEMIKSGTTCFNDMYFFENIILEEAHKAGMRAVGGESIIDFPTPSFKTKQDGFKRSEELIQKWEGDSLIHPSVCVHAPYTCCEETLRQAKDLADRYDTILQIHLAETLKEVEDIQSQKGLSPAEYLYSIGLLDKNVLAAHGVWLNENDRKLLSKTKTSIAHCPKSNLKLGSGIANIDQYIKDGINVSIGTDGTASNNSLDMVEELRLASLLAKGAHHDPLAIDAYTAIEMATINGARSLNIDTVTGSLEIGKSADLIIINTDTVNMQPVFNIYSAITYAANSHNIRSSMVNGKWIMLNREIININQLETLEIVKHISASLL